MPVAQRGRPFCVHKPLMVMLGRSPVCMYNVRYSHIAKGVMKGFVVSTRVATPEASELLQSLPSVWRREGTTIRPLFRRPRMLPSLIVVAGMWNVFAASCDRVGNDLVFYAPRSRSPSAAPTTSLR